MPKSGACGRDAVGLTALGFSHSRTWTPDELNRRYLAERADGLHIGAGPGRLMLAAV